MKYVLGAKIIDEVYNKRYLGEKVLGRVRRSTLTARGSNAHEVEECHPVF